MQNWAIIAIIVIALVAIGLLARYFLTGNFVRSQLERKSTIVSALIDIYASGSHHVELIPKGNVHPVDLVQLAISYIANVIFVTQSDTPELNIGLERLVGFTVENADVSNMSQFAQKLNDLVKAPAASLHPDGRHAVGESERYQVNLIRGKDIDYSVSHFSIRGYKPNLSNSALYLYSSIAQKLDEAHLRLLHESFAGLLLFFQDRTPTISNHQSIAFAVVDYVISNLSGIVNIGARSVDRNS